MSALAVSVVIPTYRRPRLLIRCLKALQWQTLPSEMFEVIVADDEANARLEMVLLRLAERLPYKLVYVPVPHSKGPAAARNKALQWARGEVVAFTDDDTIPSPGWLLSGLQCFGPSVAAVLGKTLVPTSVPPSDYERNVARLEGAGFITANCFCRLTVLKALGGFDERFARAWREDSDLYFRIVRYIERGSKFSEIAHASDAIVVHPVRPCLWGVSVALQKNNIYNALLFKKHPEQYRALIQARPPWLYYLIVLALVLMVIGAVAGYPVITGVGALAWLLATVYFIVKRTSGTRDDLKHRFEMTVTSFLIPPVAVYWRLYGAMRYKVMFF